MKIDIYRVLGLSNLKYKNYVTNFFNVWCDHISGKIYVPAWELQKSTALYNYFLTTWDEKVVRPFLLQNIEYLKAGIVDTEVFFDLFENHLVETNHFTNKYPSAITNKIKENHYKTILKHQ